MPNIHTPERQPNESQAAYRERMRDSRAVAKRLMTDMGPATRRPPRKTKAAPRYYPTGQHPKFAKARKHWQHSHPQRDDNGAFTLVGRNLDGRRRQWLAGISAQRGF